MTMPLPASLARGLSRPDERDAVDWWESLGEADRAEVASACDAADEVRFFVADPAHPQARVPRVIGGRFVPRDDTWGLDDWGPDWFQHLLDHPELMPDHDPPLKYHIGCTRHTHARACLDAGEIPADFACPFDSAGCPMRRAVDLHPPGSGRGSIRIVAFRREFMRASTDG